MSYKAGVLTVFIACLSSLMSTAFAAEEAPNCQLETFHQTPFTICEFSASEDIRLFWGVSTKPFGEFKPLSENLAESGLSLDFAMNAGMYHKDRSPVGLFVADGKVRTQVQTKASVGNFGMLPNGVFHISKGRAGVTETLSYVKGNVSPTYATQSGPMLIIDGAFHPKFNEGSTSTRIRNGVGVSQDGRRVFFVKSEKPVNFYNFARLFKERLGASNALYLDGVVSRVFDAQTGRRDFGVRMGPILGVVRPSEDIKE